MADLSGQQLGNYRLRHLLGRGGYADVYLGEHIHLETLAAIKVLDIHMGSNELADFLREAKTIAHLLHPCIVRVLDFGVERNMPFLVMDYAPNGTLRQRYPKETCLPLLTIISYVTQVAQALQYAHNRKVIHRDVKPENMLLGINNQVLLSDFGISIIEQNTSILVTQKRLSSSPTGTCYYMAPEQIQGSAHPASDQYALGVVVYEWLCGSRPFSGEFFAVMYQHVNVPPPPLREKIPEISPAVEHVVLRALAKDPQQRFATIEDFAKALEQASQAQEPATLLTRSRSEQPVLNPVQQVRQRQEDVIPPAWPRRAPEPPGIIGPVHRSRGLFTGKSMLLVGLILIIVVGSAAFLLSTSNKGSNARPAVNTHATASFRATATAAINAYNVATASGIMLGFNAQHTHVNPYERALTPVNVAMLAQAWKANTGGSIGSAPTVANGIVYINSSSGKMYAISAGTGEVLWNKPIGSYDFGNAPTVANGVVYMGGFDHKLYALDSETGATLWTAPTGGRIGSSPTLANGVIYIGSDDGTLYAFDAATGATRWSVPTGSFIRSSPAVANGVVYVGSDDNNLYAIKADTGAILWKVLSGDKIRSSPAVANGVVYVGSDDNNLYAIKADTGTILWKVLSGGKIRSSPAIANGVVYVGSEDRKLYAFDAATGKLRWSFLSGDTIDSSPAIANGVLYIGSNDHKLYAFNASGCGRASCSPLWAASTGGPVSASPTVANGFVYIGSNDGNLYAFHLTGVTP